MFVLKNLQLNRAHRLCFEELTVKQDSPYLFWRTCS